MVSSIKLSINKIGSYLELEGDSRFSSNTLYAHCMNKP